MIEEYQSPRVGDQSLQGDNEQIHIIDLTDEWNEIRNEIDGRHDVGDRTEDEHFVNECDARIGNETEQQSHEVRQLTDVVEYGAPCAPSWPAANGIAVLEGNTFSLRTSSCRRCHQSFSSPLPATLVSC